MAKRTVRGTAFLSALLLVASACQTNAGDQHSRKPDPLADADAQMYAGNYDGAEKSYLSLTGFGNSAQQAHTKAHYSRLLDYENRFAEAVAQAHSAVSTQADSQTLAHLTRALDWSEDVNSAIEAGARATTAAPVDALAHAYYSEALSDSAQFTAARAELAAAEKTARDPYSRAEVDREWSNYYRGKGDALEELNHLQLSLRLQPQFPERILELARHQYNRKKPEAARAMLIALQEKHPRDYGVNVAAADSAFLQQDVDTAESFYRAALKVRPDGAAATLGLAEIEVAVKRDFASAHDRLVQSVKASPASADVYFYLRYLDLLVLKKDPDRDLAAAGISSPPPSGIADARRAAMGKANSYRAAVGLAPVPEVAAIAESALAHCYFWLFNFTQPGVRDLKIHSEDPALPGAFGSNSSDRARHFGYPGSRTAEVISHVYIPDAAIDKWVDTVFHRFPFTDRETTGAGYGQAQVGAISIQVMDFGVSEPSKQPLIVYPAPEQKNVPIAFVGGEIPDPAPGARYPTGYPITLQVGSASQLMVVNAELVGPDGKTLDGYVVATGMDLHGHQWSVLPREPLKVGGRYTMTVSGTVDGQPFQKRWSFTVIGP